MGQEGVRDMLCKVKARRTSEAENPDLCPYFLLFLFFLLVGSFGYTGETRHMSCVCPDGQAEGEEEEEGGKNGVPYRQMSEARAGRPNKEQGLDKQTKNPKKKQELLRSQC